MSVCKGCSGLQQTKQHAFFRVGNPISDKKHGGIEKPYE